MIFRVLTQQETVEFREHAELNDPENLEHWSIYHPVCRLAWMDRGIYPPAIATEAARLLELKLTMMEAANHIAQED